MKLKISNAIYSVSLYLISLATYGQSSFSLSVPIIFSIVEAPNNWNPSTTINRQNLFKGQAIGSGVNLSYSFLPTFIIKNKKISINLGVGYFKQRFDLERPFDYVSPAQPIFYTNYYSYSCLQYSAGVSYKYSLSQRYFLTGNLSYNWFNSFQQEYTPTYSIVGTGYFTQTNNNQIDFGNTLVFSVGFNRSLGNRFSFGINIIAPLYVSWRNDKIFKDDPSKFFNPKFSLGSNISIAYLLNRKL
jgi:hypothetical protein